jgi:hypothetical protein
MKTERTRRETGKTRHKMDDCRVLKIVGKEYKEKKKKCRNY